MGEREVFYNLVFEDGREGGIGVVKINEAEPIGLLRNEVKKANKNQTEKFDDVDLKVYESMEAYSEKRKPLTVGTKLRGLGLNDDPLIVVLPKEKTVWNIFSNADLWKMSLSGLSSFYNSSPKSSNNLGTRLETRRPDLCVNSSDTKSLVSEEFSTTHPDQEMRRRRRG